MWPYSQNLPVAELLRHYHAEQGFNGAGRVATHGEIDFLSSAGIGNRENPTPISPTSRFRIASVTKVFTAVLVMKLVEKGTLRLDGRIGDDFLPDGAIVG